MDAEKVAPLTSEYELMVKKNVEKTCSNDEIPYHSPWLLNGNNVQTQKNVERPLEPSRQTPQGTKSPAPGILDIYIHKLYIYIYTYTYIYIYKLTSSIILVQTILASICWLILSYSNLYWSISISIYQPMPVSINLYQSMLTCISLHQSIVCI